MSPAKTAPNLTREQQIASMSKDQLLAAVGVLADQARSHGSAFERASGVAHAALDLAVTWIEAR